MYERFYAEITTTPFAERRDIVLFLILVSWFNKLSFVYVGIVLFSLGIRCWIRVVIDDGSSGVSTHRCPLIQRLYEVV